MDSPLEVIDGEFDTALLTTFTVDLEFIDRWVLPLLGRAAVRSVVILCDDTQLADHLIIPASSRAGRAYHVGTVPCAGVFHPKLIHLTREDRQVACVSSANLTAAGQLRNLETAVVLDSEDETHRSALAQINQFERQLAESQPEHITEALFDLITETTEPIDPDAAVQFLHNLNRPIISQLPDGPINAIAPFASPNAAETLHDRNGLDLYLDHRSPDLTAGLIAGAWNLSTVRFIDQHGEPVERHLHGKAIWNNSADWCLVGSPNLTQSALLATRQNGNIEAAVLIRDLDSFEMPLHETIDNPIPHVPTTPKDSTLDKQEDDELAPATFRAILDGALYLEGLPDGAVIEAAGNTGWVRLGTVVAGVIDLPDPYSPVRQLRTRTSTGQTLYAIVHDAPQLRYRRHRRVSRSSDVVEKLPLDLQGVRELEKVLADLYTLDELVAEELDRQKALSGTAPVPTVRPAPLSEWQPARLGGEPKIPDLYGKAASNDPDVLLALVRHALRLDTEPTEPAIEDNERLTDEDADQESTEETESPPPTTAVVVNRYRKSLVGILDRGAERVRDARDPVVRDLTFQTVLAFHEKLASIQVRVKLDDARELGVTTTPDQDDMVEIPLVEPENLIIGRFAILDAYLLSTKGQAGDCAPTLLTHLAAALDNHRILTDVHQRRLEKMCLQTARQLLEASPTTAGSSPLPGFSIKRCHLLLEPYAARTDWSSITENARKWIGNPLLHKHPFPALEGTASFTNATTSPGWLLLGYCSVVGFRAKEPFALIVHNSNLDSSVVTHLLTVTPVSHNVRIRDITESWQRRVDGKWLTRTLKGVTAAEAEQLDSLFAISKLLGTLSGGGYQETTRPPEICEGAFTEKLSLATRWLSE